MEINLVTKLRLHLINKTFATLFLRGIGVIILFAVSLMMTNNFSPDEVGQYEFIRVFLLVIGSLCLIGSDVSIIFFAGKLKALDSFYSLKHVYFSILKIVALLSLTTFFLFVIFIRSNQIDSELGTGFYDIIFQSLLCLIFYTVSNLNSEVLRAIEKPFLSELFRNVIKYIPLIVGIVIQIIYPLDFSISQYYIYGFLIVAVISQGFVLYYLQKIPVQQNELIIEKKEILKTSFPMGISSIIMFLLLSIDVFLIKRFFGNEEVAFYAIAIKLITVLSIIILSININISSQLSEYYTSKRTVELQKLCKSTAKKTFYSNAIVAVIMIAFIEPILLAYGESYLYIKEAFYILIISQVYTSSLGAVPVYLNMTGRAKIYQFVLLISLLVNVILNFLLVPNYGVIGAAITFSITVILWNTLVAIYVYKNDSINLGFL